MCIRQEAQNDDVKKKMEKVENHDIEDNQLVCPLIQKQFDKKYVCGYIE